jgi:hypothetical protein
MLPVRNTPESQAPSAQLARRARRIADVIRRHRLEESLSWLGWLISVAIFAFWTLMHYHAPSGPPWIGMTIHTGVFAIWALVARTWLMAHFMRRQGWNRSTEDKE